MSIFVFLICFCIFSAWLFYEQKKSTQMEKKASEEFWEREARANAARNKDISSLPLLEVDESDLPSCSSPDESITYYIGLLKENIKRPMMDLSSYSNTDLKLAYGVGNFNTLSSYDENFNTFLLNLTNLARAFYRAGLYDDAIRAFSQAIGYGSKKSADYLGLADAWLAKGAPEKVAELIEKLEKDDAAHRSSVIQSLKDLLANYK